MHINHFNRMQPIVKANKTVWAFTGGKRSFQADPPASRR